MISYAIKMPAAMPEVGLYYGIGVGIFDEVAKNNDLGRI